MNLVKILLLLRDKLVLGRKEAFARTLFRVASDYSRGPHSHTYMDGNVLKRSQENCFNVECLLGLSSSKMAPSLESKHSLFSSRD